VAAALPLFAPGLPVMAQNYPAKTIRYIVPFPPGGATDTLARTIAQKLNAAWGEPVVVDNRPGAGGNLGTELVAKSPPDGHTLLLAVNSHAINASLYARLPYDPVKDFAPVSLLATTPNVLVVHPSLPVRTVKDLIALAKSKPSQLTFASAGAGSGAHLAGELFQSMAGVALVHVPYKGIVAGVTELMGGQVSLTFAVLPVVYPQVQAGKLRALAVTSAQRSALVPDLPTVAESGMKGFDVVSWFGTLVPAGTPPEVIGKLNRELVKILYLPDVKQKLSAIGLEVKGSSPAEFATFIKADWAIWDKVIKRVGIRVD
jgi:tripartite-type tricarboxylate transporter receptor subunit TctC